MSLYSMYIASFTAVIITSCGNNTSYSVHNYHVHELPLNKMASEDWLGECVLQRETVPLPCILPPCPLFLLSLVRASPLCRHMVAGWCTAWSFLSTSRGHVYDLLSLLCRTWCDSEWWPLCPEEPTGTMFDLYFILKMVTSLPCSMFGNAGFSALVRTHAIPVAIVGLCHQIGFTEAGYPHFVHCAAVETTS